MGNEIRHRLSLEGDEDVKNRLKEVGEAGKQSLSNIHDSFEKANDKAGAHGELLDKLKDKFLGGGERESGGEREGGGEGKFGKLKEGFHQALDSAAEGAELELGTTFSVMIVAAKAGIAGFAATIGGFLVGKLEKLGDEVNDRVQRLWSFKGSLEKGKEANENLVKTADELKVPASGLAPVNEQLLRTDSVLQPKDQLGDHGISDVLKSFVSGANADRADFGKATEAITKFIADLRENGRLTTENAKSLFEVMPKFTERLLSSLQERYGKSGYYSTSQVLSTARELGPQLSQDEAASNAAAPSSIGTAYTTLKASTEKLAEEISGGHIIAGTLENTAKFIDSVAGGVKKIKEAQAHAAETQAPIPEERANELRDQRGFGPIQGPQQYDVLRRPPSTQAPEGDPIGVQLLKYIFGVKGQTYAPEKDASQAGVGGIEAENAAHAEAANAEHEAANAHADAAKKVESLGEAAGGAQKKLDGLNKFEKELPAIGAHLQTEQAKIDNQFAPAEEQSKLGHDELAVQNAKLQQQQARIAQQEATKNQELARLAPEQSRENVASAESRFNKAWHARNVAHGISDNFDPVRQQLDDIDNEFDAAQTALKRAKIERKYSYLEEPKAKLAAEKAVTDIRSADYLRSDSELKLAKDQAGQNLSPEVASLRYAQAMLDEQKEVAKLNGEEVEVLKDILAALEHGKGGKGGKGGDGGEDSDNESDDEKSSGKKSAATPLQHDENGWREVAKGVWSKIKEDGTTDADVFKPNNGAPFEPFNPVQKAPTTGSTPQTKEGFVQDQERAVEELKEDWASQRQLNENIARQNGGYQSAREQYPYSPGGHNPGYRRATHGHYDPRTQNFIPDEPTYPDGTPKSDDYEFAGRKNPAGPYTEGISSPLTFPRYNQRQLQELPSENFPEGVPLPQPRPPAADQQSSADQTQQVAGLSDVLRSIVESITAAAQKVAPAQNLNAGPDTQAVGVRADNGEEAEQNVAGLGDAADGAKGSLSDLTSAFASAASQFQSAGSEASAATTEAADGGLIQRFDGGGAVHGPGTSTSDDVLARLSHGEYVVNARETGRNLSTLKAINEGSFPKHLSKMFASGGLIELPHFSDGGPVMASLPRPGRVPQTGDISSGEHGTAGYHAIDMRTGFGDFRVLAPEHVARSMSAAARDSANAQTGQRPSWYKGR